MGDVLPPKRDTVERLRRRVEHYRGHHNACLPRYEQAANSLRELERQDTLLLKQRYLESKAKKAKSKNEHRSYKETSADIKAQLAKPLKRVAEEQPICSVPLQGSNNDDGEKAAKIARTEEKKPDLQLPQNPLKTTQQTSTLPSFSVQIVQQFSNQPSSLSSTVQSSVTVQNLPKPLNSPITQVSQPVVQQQCKTEIQCGQEEKSSSGLTLECKQEKDLPDLCQFQNANGGVCLADTFPSIGVNDDSGEDMLPPDVLKDLIEDVATNHDLMADFFDDSVGSLKDQENVTKGIIELVKDTSSSFPSDNGAFVSPPTHQQQLNGLFRSFPGGNETPISTISSPVTTSALYNQQPQRPSYMNPGAGMDCLRFDYKMNEPTGSLAARTLKQLAEQHQNLQQMQVFNSPLSTRPPFNQDNRYVNQTNPSTNFLNGAVIQGSEKTPNSASNLYTLDRLSEEFFGTSCEQLSPSSRFDVAKQRETNNPQQMEQQKPPPYGTTRPLTHFSDNPMSITGNRQVPNSSELRFQLPQQVHLGQVSPQQMQQDLHEFKQQQQPNKMDSNLYNSYPHQQNSANPAFHMSQPLTYSSQFSPTLNKPPPEYKSHHHNLVPGNPNLVEQLNGPSQPMYSQANKAVKFGKQQRSPNVTITPDGLALPSSTYNWRLNMANLQQQQPAPHPNQFRGSTPNYGNLVSGLQTNGAPVSPLYNQYRLPASHNSRMSRPNMLPSVMVQQRMVVPQCQGSPTITGLEQHSSMTISNNSSPNRTLSPVGPYSAPKDTRNDRTLSPMAALGSFAGPKHVMDRNNGSSLNLDIFDGVPDLFDLTDIV